MAESGQSSRAASAPTARARGAASADRRDRFRHPRAAQRARPGRAGGGRAEAGHRRPVYSAAREQRDRRTARAARTPAPSPSEGLGARLPRDRLGHALPRGGASGRLPRARRGPSRTWRRSASSASSPSCGGLRSIADVFAAVERGKAHLGVVPVENTTEGVVTQTLDAFAESDAPDLRRDRAAYLPRSASRRAAASRTCGAWRRTRSRWPSAGAGSTGTSRASSASRPRAPPSPPGSRRRTASVAAIGSAIAGEVYGLARSSPPSRTAATTPRASW